MAGTQIVLFADFTCPFSYVTEAALRPLAASLGVEVAYRAFELFPAPAPLPPPGGHGEHADALRALAEAAGVELSVPPLVPRTRKAHEAARFARDREVEGVVRDAIFRAYWRDGRDIGRIDVLASVAAADGIDPDDLRIALDIDTHADAVLADRAGAERLGIQHTPTLLVSGGRETQVYLGALGADQLRAILRDAARGSGGGVASEP